MKFSDVERQHGRGSFDDIGSRRDFILKVYSILSVQLMFTLAVVSAFVFSPDVQVFVKSHVELLFVALAGVLIVLFMMCCCYGLLRSFPCNFFILAIFTICMSILVGYSTMRYRSDLVLLAVAITAAVVILLTIFAMQTKIDFTIYGGVLFVGLILLVILSLVGFFFFQNRTLQLIISWFGAIIFACYLVYDTQMIVGGDHKVQFDEEDYILAVFSLYIDIINMFLYILSLLGLYDDG